MRLSMDTLAASVAIAVGVSAATPSHAEAHPSAPTALEQQWQGPENLQHVAVFTLQNLSGRIALLGAEEAVVPHSAKSDEVRADTAKASTNAEIELCNRVDPQPGTVLQTNDTAFARFQFTSRITEPDGKVVRLQSKLSGQSSCIKLGKYPVGTVARMAPDGTNGEPGQYIVESKSPQVRRLSHNLLKVVFTYEDKLSGNPNFNIPSFQPGTLVFCTHADYRGCAGTWLKEAGGDPSTDGGGTLLQNPDTKQVDPNVVYIDDSTYCSPGTSTFVPVTTNGSAKCVQEWVNYYRAEYPDDTIYAGVNPTWGVRQRFKGALALYEFYPALTGQTDRVPCGAQAYILQRSLTSTNSSGGGIFSLHPDMRGYTRRWETAINCKNPRPIVLGAY